MWTLLLLLWMVRIPLWMEERQAARLLCRELASRAPESAVLRGEVEGSTLHSLVRDPEWVVPALGKVSGVEVRFQRSQEGEGQGEWEGRFACVVPFRNPSWLGDGIGTLGRAQIAGTAVVSRQGAVRVARSPFARFPRVQGFLDAAWKGDTAALPAELLPAMRVLGLMPVLAISGQHVGSLLWVALCLLAGGRAFLHASSGRRLLGGVVRSLLPLACALLLWRTSRGEITVGRCVFVLLLQFYARLRGWSFSPLQVLGASAGLSLAWNPSWICSKSFVLSYAGCIVLCVASEELPRFRMLGRLALLGAAMPVLLLPLVAYEFSEVSLVAPILSVIVAPLWEIILIPLLFVFQPVALLLPLKVSFPLCAFLESALTHWVAWHVHLARYLEWAYRVIPCPTVLEMITAEVVGVLSFCALFARRSRPIF